MHSHIRLALHGTVKARVELQMVFTESFDGPFHNRTRTEQRFSVLQQSKLRVDLHSTVQYLLFIFGICRTTPITNRRRDIPQKVFN